MRDACKNSLVIECGKPILSLVGKLRMLFYAGVDSYLRGKCQALNFCRVQRLCKSCPGQVGHSCICLARLDDSFLPVSSHSKNRRYACCSQIAILPHIKPCSSNRKTRSAQARAPHQSFSAALLRTTRGNFKRGRDCRNSTAASLWPIGGRLDAGHNCNLLGRQRRCSSQRASRGCGQSDTAGWYPTASLCQLES